MSQRYYSIELELDGMIALVQDVSETIAAQWLWQHIRRGTVESSLVRVRRCDFRYYDSDAGLFGLPGYVNPLTGRELEFS